MSSSLFSLKYPIGKWYSPLKPEITVAWNPPEHFELNSSRLRPWHLHLNEKSSDKCWRTQGRSCTSSSIFTWPGFMKRDITLMTFLNPIRTVLVFIYSGTDLDGCHCHISTILWRVSGSLRRRAKVLPGKAGPRTLSHEIYSVT